jgi:hypothetical protein
MATEVLDMPVAEMQDKLSYNSYSEEDLLCPISLEGIENVASTVFERLNMEPGSELRQIVSDLGGEIKIDNTFGEHDSGSIDIRGKGDFTIYLPPTTGYLRDRFTIAHELGHYILHSRFGEKILRQRRYGRGKLETQANAFAAAFLMPKALFLKEIQNYQERSLDIVAHLAAKFLVSTSAAEIRYRSLKRFLEES